MEKLNSLKLSLVLLLAYFFVVAFGYVHGLHVKGFSNSEFVISPYMYGRIFGSVIKYFMGIIFTWFIFRKKVSFACICNLVFITGITVQFIDLILVFLVY